MKGYVCLIKTITSFTTRMEPIFSAPADSKTHAEHVTCASELNSHDELNVIDENEAEVLARLLARLIKTREEIQQFLDDLTVQHAKLPQPTRNPFFRNASQSVTTSHCTIHYADHQL